VIPCNPPKQKVTAVDQGLKVQYLAAQAANDEEILPYLEIFNGSTSDVPLSELTLRYWLIRDGGTMVAECDYAVLQCSQIKRSVGTACGRGADTYIEVGFVSGTLGKAKNTGDIQLRLHRSDWGAVDQSNDYSYDATRTSYGDYKRVTLYRKGALIWGEEP
jgi:mannan endo-1,4-beta-mannosidase